MEIEISGGVTSTVSSFTSDAYVVDNGGTLVVTSGGIVARDFTAPDFLDTIFNNGR